jgi:peroxiredoxin
LLAVIGSVVVGTGSFLAALTMMMMISSTVTSASPDRLLVAGSLAPDFALSDPTGKPVRLSDFRGKPVVVVFWATWSPESLDALSDLNRIHAKGMPVIAVNLLEKRDRVMAAVREKGMRYTVAIDPDGEVGRAYGAEAIPNIFVIDERGRVAEHRYTPPEF